MVANVYNLRYSQEKRGGGDGVVQKVSGNRQVTFDSVFFQADERGGREEGRGCKRKEAPLLRQAGVTLLGCGSHSQEDIARHVAL